MRLPPRMESKWNGSSNYAEAALRAMRKIVPYPTEKDGSQRLLAYCRQAKRFGFTGKQGIALVRQMLEECPTPREWTDKQIEKRLADADVEVGEAKDNGVLDIPPWEKLDVVEPERKEAKTRNFEAELTEIAFKTGGFIGDYIEHNLETARRPQPIFALAGGIALTATLIGRKVRDAFGTRPNVQIICVGKTSSGKDHARCLNNEILASTDNGNLIAPEEFTSDTAVYRTLAENPCQLVQLDEFGRFLAASQSQGSSHLRGVVTALMKCYTSAGMSRFIPKSYANKKDNPDIVVEYPHLVLLATTTPDAVYQAMGISMVEDGFLGRCLLFESKDQPRLALVPEKVFPFHMRGYVESWKYMEETIVGIDDDALAEFVAAEEFSHSRLTSNARAAGIWGRFQQKAMQLALISACSRWDGNGEIGVSEEDAKWACNLMSVLTDHMTEIAGEWLAENAQEAAVQKVYRVIKDNPNIALNQLTRRTQWLKGSDRNEILNTLRDSGQISISECKTGKTTKFVFSAITTSRK